MNTVKPTMHTPFRLCLMLLCLMLSATALQAVEPVSASVQSYNGVAPADIRYNFSGAAYRIQTYVDTTPNFNSKYLRIKYIRATYDTMMNLKLGRTYYIRTTYVDANNNMISDYYRTYEFYVAGYPRVGDVDFSRTKQINTRLVNKLTFPIGAYLDYDLLYDTSPNFNSPAFRQFLSPGQTQAMTHLLKNNHHYYLRARVRHGAQLLDWKTVEVNNTLKPYITPPGRNCTPDQQVSFSVYNLGATTIFGTTLYFKKGSINDSFYLGPVGSYVKTLPYADYKGMLFVLKGKFEADGDTIQIIDSTILDADFNDEYLFTTPYGTQSGGFRFANIPCVGDSIQIELYSDTTLSKRLYRLDTIKRTTSPFDFTIPGYSYIDGHVLRFRYAFPGYYSLWKYYYQKQNPLLIISNLSASDSMNTAWPISKTTQFSGVQVEIEHDVLPDFSSPKKQVYRKAEAGSFTLPVLFGRKNYARLRLTRDTVRSDWSNTIERSCFSGIQPMGVCQARYPSVLLTGFLWKQSQTEFRYGQDSLKLDLYSQPFQVLFGPLTLGRKVFVQQRFFSEVDTSVWSKTYGCNTINPSNYCCNPFLEYNGYQQPQDTFHLRWKHRNDSKVKGYYVFVGSSQRIYGHFYVAYPDSVFVVERKLFPPDWIFWVDADCGQTGIKDMVNKWPLGTGNGFVADKELLYWSANSASLYTGLSGKLQIADINGRVMHTQTLDAPYTVIALQELPPGLYVASIQTAYGLFTLKLQR